jgi:two-component system response regulator AtoC
MVTSSWTSGFDELPPEELIFGHSRQMELARANIDKIATASVPILIRGESGSGKETIAKMIHRLSPRSKGPFVKVSCAAIPHSLFESELFGYEKGAFTGAYEARSGLVERAQRGTLLLDEVAALSLAMQGKLLELMQDCNFARLGGGESRAIDARILCTTSRMLERDVARGTFRDDLFYRVNVVVLNIPPLRERKEDIPALVDYFCKRFNRDFRRNTGPISDRTLKLLLEHDWPGNIRELENLMKRYVVLESQDVIVTELLGDGFNSLMLQLNGNGGSISLKTLTRQAVRDLERKIILQVLHASNWNRKEAARVLKVSYRGLFYKIKNAGVSGKKLKVLSPDVRRSEEI